MFGSGLSSDVGFAMNSYSFHCVFGVMVWSCVPAMTSSFRCFVIDPNAP